MRFLMIVSATCLLPALFARAQTIPAGRITDWRHAGFHGAMRTNITTINIRQLGAVSDSSAAVDAYIQAAIDSLQGRMGVIYFPPGYYLVNSMISLPDSITLRGAGADSTTLIFNLNGAPDDCIDVSKNQDEVLNPFTKIISGFQKGSASVTVADASSFVPGSYAEIREDNGNWYTHPASYAEKSVGQIVRIVSIAGNALGIEPALRIDFDTSLNAEIRRLNPITDVGIECLKITRRDTSVSHSVYNINFQYAVNCRVTGVESDRSVGAHIMIEQCKNIEVSGCYIHHAFAYDGSGSRGYGVCLRQHASDCLVENNFFRHLRHAMMVKEGANGNVFGYNYSIEPTRTETPFTDFSGDISLHGHYPFLNLFEGNIVQNIITDHFWGEAGPYNTFFRNRAELFGLGLLPPSGSTPITSNQNYAGNEITNPSAPYGNYLMIGAGHFEYGNNVKGAITPSGTASLPDSTYYLTGRPAFWTSASWPAIGIPNAINTGSIPARQRYISGETLTVCEIAHILSCDTMVCDDTDPCTFDSCIDGQCQFAAINCDDGDSCTLDECVNGVCIYYVLTGCHMGVSWYDSGADILIYPNPADGFLIVEPNPKQTGITLAKVLITDYTGRAIQGESLQSYSDGNSCRITFPESMNCGLYLLRLIYGEETFHYKFIKTNQEK